MPLAKCHQQRQDSSRLLSPPQKSIDWLRIPLYICASASTPIAAALVLKGLSPGTALVFLLAGPATNAATMTVVARQLGRGAMVVYLLAIAACSLATGWLVNRAYEWTGMDVMTWASHAGHGSESWFYPASAIVLILLLIRTYRPRRNNGADCACSK